MTTTAGIWPTGVARTEERLADSAGLDEMTSLEVLILLNRQDATVPAAVARQLPTVARLVDAADAALAAGGAIHYFGAGTSGRLAVLDAVELLPTFNLGAGTVIPHIAGGDTALVRAVENSEDSEDEGAAAAAGLGPHDVAIGLTASGRTPYVGAALRAARRAGAVTALITNNPGAALSADVDLAIEVDTGPEALTGSTRLKAGTAQKLVLNGFSTALMVRRGRVWSNLMVSLVATNAKLRDRTVRILAEATGRNLDLSHEALVRADGDLKKALVATLCDVDVDVAHRALTESSGSVREAIRALTP
ncbi:N-acetylmuramic acid 6-phosphate etherase [Actinotalea sp. K2]|uniref:N-acetylmuramic acid 6-phosphate etherase n=1 Tax=Actinotalea sp. K2 TaxID=2939438 RepID=UPI002017D710|nr:N-acetylmuramic acid 6-phosphate etherase [Actinotalea sp. K2]MCL3861721.1 N-acetylmuramic acid 6-phosphate etherase [Actinotalea sp. K2]